jgi:uncharacterized protein YdcH (DUF465 family)
MAEKQDQMSRDFEQNKTNRLAKINEEGKYLSAELVQTNKIIEYTSQEISSLKAQADHLASDLKTAISAELDVVTAPDPDPIQHQITRLEQQILASTKLDLESLKNQKAGIQSEIYDLQVALGKKEVIDRGKARIKELLAEEKKLSQQISDLEKQEFAMEAFTRSRMDMVQSRINGKFKLVRFRMFSQLINGGIEECCDCMVQGVPFSDVNSAGKIQAGIDVINTLSKHYGITAPIWIDNRESTNTIPATQSQIINLVVSTDKTLTIK